MLVNSSIDVKFDIIDLTEKIITNMTRWKKFIETLATSSEIFVFVKTIIVWKSFGGRVWTQQTPV